MRAAFYTLGCKVNQYETDALEAQFRDRGYEIVPFSDAADVYIVNTCTVTGIADKKSRQMLHRARKTNPEALIVAAGCYADDAPELLSADPDIDMIAGNAVKADLADLVEERLGSTGLNASPVRSAVKRGSNTRAYVKIQDGCDQYCSYCIIPYVRGHIKSRTADDIVSEIKELAEAGYREAVLTGIHISSWGLDRAGKTYNRDPENSLFGELLERICEESGMERLRLGSLEPRIITEELVKKLSKHDEICPQFHLSLQSGCDSTLARMNRHYTKADYMKSLHILRKYYDDPAVTTDIIVGFPRETDDEFAETLSFAEAAGFSRIHVFKFSPRKGTKAYTMAGQVPESVKKERSAALQLLADRLSAAYAARHEGKTVSVLTEKEGADEYGAYYTGYTREYIPVHVRGLASGSNEIVEGVLADKKVSNGAGIYTVFGEIDENAGI